ncbi:glycoside hydrolase family 88 protein [Amycolatopsis anabasis]|uniref:glycoside hydrolase family 88 protein n=1 Tax=Amycolatopsis anabasis TaxID=1840409 RepID=UPI00131C82FF|nr:glycoside hydrolase family 88 protein [Amycolatopsis anabasis]
MTLSRRALLSSTAVAVGAAAVPAPALAAEPGPDFADAVDYALAKLRVTAPNAGGFPVGTRFEKWTYSQNGDWVGGFWPGALLLAWVYSEDTWFREHALDWARKLAPRQDDTGTHDLGFLFTPSWVTAWRLTGDPRWRDGAVRAASSLIKRYNEKGRFIRAWGALGDPRNAGRVIIDTMMNLDLLAFATEQTADPKYLTIATEHALTTRRVFVRPDGSTPHVFDFDPETGAARGPGTVQGYSPTSCWSRGQAWGIYGFTTMYRRTRDKRFLETATELADFALRALTPDHVPVWDYLAPQAPNDIKDASAGAVMACGLLDLAAAAGKARYRDSAVRILRALTRTCLTTRSTRAEAIVARCTRNRPSEDGVEISLPYADYYLLEGLLRILRPKEIARALAL